jgi:hypothetical protein
MAIDALAVKGVPGPEAGLGTVTLMAPDTRFPGFQFPLIDHIFPLFVTVMALFAGKPGFDMTEMREGDRRAFPRLKGGALQSDLVRLCPEISWDES